LTWVTGKAGQDIWKAKQITLSPEQLCHLLTTTQAHVYGLLISPQFAVILSSFHHTTFERLEERYRQAAQTGLCFWFDGAHLHYLESYEAFLELVQTLPQRQKGPQLFI
jgi:hypothetical protein